MHAVRGCPENRCAPRRSNGMSEEVPVLSRGVSVLDDLRVNMSRGELARYLAEFGTLVGVEASSQRLAAATGGLVDLRIEAHRIALITWLRAWGCRHLRRGGNPRNPASPRASAG